MRCGITGASGLVGGNLAVELLRAGHQVVAIKRANSKTEHLKDFKIEWVDGELTEPTSLRKAFEGCDVVFHCAAAVSIQKKIDKWMVQTNVIGTRNVIEVVRQITRCRLVHCSTVAALGISPYGELGTEKTPFNLREVGLDDAYAVTKRQAQDLVFEACKSGLDGVVVHPTYMLGPYDVKPSSGAIILNLLRGQIPGYTPGRNNFSDVRDVARGLRLAAEKGRRGENYILGGHNMSYQEFMDLVCDVGGTPRLKRQIPKPIALAVGFGGDLYQKFSGREAALNSAKIRWSFNPNFVFSSDKAQSQLGYTISPLKNAVEDAIKWFKEIGKL